ncbi:hypothetical protein HK103_000947 [Boothiomyces macroporosus]|uniref:Uncharacterized protein n=1 Tax=Boothiomyces macroporosus TaxID=261099 RepID=A0AAD5UMW4_9FUNG|nr:hypothetical protein HK103_000947 [Boothiomyces macroporosus]
MKRKEDSLESSKKKVKFDENGPDLDDDDLDLEVRKKGFKEDGYESDDAVDDNSDSDDDLPTNKMQEEDIFQEEQPKKTFLKSRDIEGQEWTMNEEMESFNMDQELQEGDFTEAGVYVKKKDEHEIHDSWLKDVSKTDIERAHIAQEIRNQRESVMNKTNETDPNILWRQILPILEPRETINKAIKRLGLAFQKVPKWKKKKAESNLSEEEKQKQKVMFDKLTNLSSKLFEIDVNAYDKSYEEIVLLLKQNKLLNHDWMPGMELESAEEDKDIEYYEYKWKDEEKLHIVERDQLLALIESGFFDKEAFVRKIKNDTALDYQSGFIPIQEFK